MKLKKSISSVKYTFSEQLFLVVEGSVENVDSQELPKLYVSSDAFGEQFVDYVIEEPTNDKNDPFAFSVKIAVESDYFTDLYLFAAVGKNVECVRKLSATKLKLTFNRQSRLLGAIDKVIQYNDFVYVSGWGIQPIGNQLVDVTVAQQSRVLDNVKLTRTNKNNRILDKTVEGQFGFELVFPLAEINPVKSFVVELSGPFETTLSLATRLSQSNTSKRFNIDQLHYISDEQTALLQLSGWYVAQKSDDSFMQLETSDGTILDAQITLVERVDLHQHDLVTPFDDASGFTLRADVPSNTDLVLKIVSTHQTQEYPLSVAMMSAFNQTKLLAKVKRALMSMNKTNVKRAIEFYNIYGLSTTVTKIKQALLHGTHSRNYAAWYQAQQPTQEQINEQKEHTFDYMPKISIVVPTYRTPENYLREMIECVINQTYANWELCIADGSNDNGVVAAMIDAYAQADNRIKYTVLNDNLGISGNTNACLELASGDFVALFDHDDLLPPQSLFEIVKVLQDRSVDVVYTDEDKIDETSQVHSGPHFKPAFSWELLRSLNYITHFFVVKKTIIDQVGGFRSEFDGAQDFDFILRCCEQAQNIQHINQILYHWRIHSNSTAGNPESKLYAYTAGARAIESHLERLNIQGSVENIGFTGYKTTFEPVGNPLVSILIPSKDNIDVLDNCLQSIFKQQAYTHYEIIIIENNSTKQETFAYYEALKAKHDNVKVVVWDGVFNYSAINNFGATFATGEYLLLLNNDTEMLEETALRRMVGMAMQDGIGAVGAKLLYPDHTIQHAGVILGIDKVPTHLLVNVPDKDKSYRHNALTNYLAVTAACLMTPRHVFDEVGGLSEDFVVAFNDIDYCLKVYEKGYRIVNDGFAKWLHYESKSRGYENTPEKIKRFMGEKERFKAKWDDKFPNGDPFYNHELPQ